MKTLHIISDLDCHAAAKQLSLLAPAISDGGIETHVCVLNTGGVFTNRIVRANLPVHQLQWKRLFDLYSIRRLKQCVSACRPNVIHVWGMAYCVLPMLAKKLIPRVALTPFQLPPQKNKIEQWLTRRSLRNVGAILVRDDREEAAWRRFAYSDNAVHVYTPAVECPPSTDRESLSWRNENDDKCMIATAGRLTANKGLKAAVLAFDMMRQVCEDSHLLIMGEGPERERIGRYARGLLDGPHVHFLGAGEKVSKYFRLADVIWAADEKAGGQNAVLEAMSVGRPVVATDSSLMRKIVIDGDNGFLVPPGDAPALGRKTFKLYRDPDMAKQMGIRGQQRALAEFNVKQLVERILPVYQKIAA